MTEADEKENRTSQAFRDLPEIAALATALIGEFGVSDRALLDVLFGRAEPTGWLPFHLPSSMQEVLAQESDVPFDMPNPACRFGYGLRYARADQSPQGNNN